VPKWNITLLLILGTQDLTTAYMYDQVEIFC
jgi:hypothetical protein